VASGLAKSSTLKMKAIGSSYTSVVFNRTTLLYTPEYEILADITYARDLLLDIKLETK
jgi:hypothetical protein